MDLEEKHEEIIDLSQEEPQYCIDNIPSAMNHQKNLKNWLFLSKIILPLQQFLNRQCRNIKTIFACNN